MKKYNHAFTIAFEVLSDNEGEDVTADELKEGLANRLRSLKHGDEILEACDLPYDTYENE